MVVIESSPICYPLDLGEHLKRDAGDYGQLYQYLRCGTGPLGPQRPLTARESPKTTLTSTSNTCTMIMPMMDGEVEK